MNPQAIFGLQIALSILVWAVIAKTILLPWLKGKPINEVLFWLILPHTFRHVGMVFLVPGIVDESLPSSFANAAAYGDLLAGVLALLAILALRTGWASAIGLVAIFNIVGTLDLVNALRHSEAIPALGAAWFIPTFIVPLLLVTHVLIFSQLLQIKSTAHSTSTLSNAA